MNNENQLSIGQLTVISSYLENYTPADTFNDETDMLLDTQSIIFEIGQDMCDIEHNALADYLSDKGYRVHYQLEDGIHGWILRPRNKEL